MEVWPIVLLVTAGLGSTSGRPQHPSPSSVTQSDPDQSGSPYSQRQEPSIAQLYKRVNDLEDPVQYEFEYAVQDYENDYGQHEARDGYNTAGVYQVRLPDTRVQRVRYRVDGDSGFIAQVQFEGEAVFPPPTAYGQEETDNTLLKRSYPAATQPSRISAPHPTAVRQSRTSAPKPNYAPTPQKILQSAPKQSYSPAPKVSLRAKEPRYSAPRRNFSPPKQSFAPATEQKHSPPKQRYSPPQRSYSPPQQTSPEAPGKTHPSPQTVGVTSEGPQRHQSEPTQRHDAQVASSYATAGIQQSYNPGQAEPSVGPELSLQTELQKLSPADRQAEKQSVSYSQQTEKHTVGYGSVDKESADRKKLTRKYPVFGTAATSLYANQKSSVPTLPLRILEETLFRSEVEKRVRYKRPRAPIRYGAGSEAVDPKDDRYVLPSVRANAANNVALAGKSVSYTAGSATDGRWTTQDIAQSYENAERNETSGSYGSRIMPGKAGESSSQSHVSGGTYPSYKTTQLSTYPSFKTT